VSYKYYIQIKIEVVLDLRHTRIQSIVVYKYNKLKMPYFLRSRASTDEVQAANILLSLAQSKNHRVSFDMSSVESQHDNDSDYEPEHHHSDDERDDEQYVDNDSDHESVSESEQDSEYEPEDDNQSTASGSVYEPEENEYTYSHHHEIDNDDSEYEPEDEDDNLSTASGSVYEPEEDDYEFVVRQACSNMSRRLPLGKKFYHLIHLAKNGQVPPQVIEWMMSIPPVAHMMSHR